ncbi:AAA family ATPase [Lysobacter changpingensis]|uniref:AAA family ATPase n=1 Tax=Lysobacter changpingensis TaxID=2792784 RepID=UPI001F5CA263|nr:AAA family ATPase [Lysobacter changpingensis]
MAGVASLDEPAHDCGRDGMTGFRTGLVVGKFCPLHRGHQSLLDQAHAQCEQLVVISYTKPEFAGFEPERRERWLAQLYPDALRLVLDDERLAGQCRQRGIEARSVPDNEAPDDVHRAFVAWLLHAVLSIEVDAVFTSESYGDGFAAMLASAQRERDGPTVVHVSVDPDRLAVPVSGTAVRSGLHVLRHRLDPVVYTDFVSRVAILGGESTGKSTLATRLADRLTTLNAPEYGRELWEQRGGVLTEADMLAIASTQVAREEALTREANRYLLCDTTPLTTMLYSQAMFGRVSDELRRLAERPYDRILLCAPDVPFVQDGTRRDEAFRQWQHNWYARELNARGFDYALVCGGWDERVERALECLPTPQTEP